MEKENYNNLTPDEIFEFIEGKVQEYMKYWTKEDLELQLDAMKNISERPIWNAIYQAKRWALIESRASTVKIEGEEERKAWFDKEIENIDTLIEQTNRK